MLSCYEGEDDLFFNSADRLSFEESIVEKEEPERSELDYEIWLCEPKSVEERRESFLRGMGLTGWERITECSGAVSSCSFSGTNREEGDMVCCGREVNSEASSMVDEMEQIRLDESRVACENKDIGPLPSLEERECSESEGGNYEMGMKKMKSWWKYFAKMRKQRDDRSKSETINEAPKTNRVKVKQNKKRCMEFTGVYMGQEIRAHEGFVWTMKFSPDGQYLATGGEDGIVRIWRLTSVDASHMSFSSGCNVGGNLKESKSHFGLKKMSQAPVLIPDKVFHIEESPLQEFHGHTSDVLDLAWSNSNHLLSSSKDKTVRLWRVGCSQCLNVFRHGNFVTCIQFNPADENYFISGSIDGKVRIWGISEKRVVDWADVRDVVSAISYQPDGKGFIVGSVTGSCRIYVMSGNGLQFEAEMHIQGRKKASGSRITGIKFLDEGSQRVLITSEDSKLRVFDGVDIVCKYKGLPKSGSQMSASFTSTGRHVISVGEDSHVYVWNYDSSRGPSTGRIKSVRSCERFFAEGVSVAVPWPGMGTEPRSLSSSGLHTRVQTEECGSCRRDSDRFALGNWLFVDGPCRGASATWPEEKLPPLWDEAIAETQCENQQQEVVSQPEHLINGSSNRTAAPSDGWGLVIVTAGWDGAIRTFHNYGLPIRV